MEPGVVANKFLIGVTAHTGLVPSEGIFSI